MIGTLIAPIARADESDGCRLVRAEGASVLQECRNGIVSFSLGLQDIRRVAGRDLHGRFRFDCLLEIMCVGEPGIVGRFIEPQQWLQSARDEAAVAHVLMELAVAAQPAPPTAVCEPFDLSIAGLPARAVCYRLGQASFAIAVVAAADDAGFVVVFSSSSGDWTRLRDRVLTLAPRFTVERVSGDLGFMRWIR